MRWNMRTFKNSVGCLGVLRLSIPNCIEVGSLRNVTPYVPTPFVQHLKQGFTQELAP